MPQKGEMMNVSLFFRWYDLWTGLYIDTAKKAVYICPIPMFGIKVSWAGFRHIGPHRWSRWYNQERLNGKRYAFRYCLRCGENETGPYIEDLA